MPLEFTLDQDARIVYSRASGDLTNAELFAHMAAIQRLFEQGTLDASWAQVNDYRAVTSAVSVTAEGIHSLAAGNPWPRGLIRVLVAPNDLIYGLARMYQIMGEPDSEAMLITRSENEAIEFVLAERRRRGLSTSPSGNPDDV